MDSIDDIIRDVPAVLMGRAGPVLPFGAYDPAGLQALEAIAQVYNAGRCAEAMALSRLYLLLDPGSAAALNILGFAGNRLGDPMVAMRALGRALAVDPRADNVRHILGVVTYNAFHEGADRYWAGELDRAESMFLGLECAVPGDPLNRAALDMIAEARRAPARPPSPGVLSRLARPSGPGAAPVWAVIIGAVRNEGEFLKIIRWLSKLRQLGILSGIVVSTWTGQVSRRPELAAEVAELGILLREAEEPRVQIKWNVIQQMVALQNGLDLCPADSYVLKVRTDRIYERQYERFIYDVLAYRDDPLMLASGDILEKRIAVFDFSLSVPFYIHDLVFFGLKRDISKLINFDIRYLFCYGSMISEQWFFSRVFVQHFPIFDTFFMVQRGHGANHEVSAKWFREMLKDQFFLDVFATYISVISKYFRVGISGQNAEIHRGSVPYLEKLSASQMLSNPAFAGYRNIATHDYWVQPLLQGLFAQDDFGRRLQEALERVVSPAFQQDYGRPESLDRPEVRAFSALSEQLMADARGRGEVWAMSPKAVCLPDLWQRV